jgi:phosphoribosyl-ATP pyrophosphohydrolase
VTNNKVTHINAAKNILNTMSPDGQTMLQKLMGTKSITQSICAWNAARYDQVPNHDLAVKLLREEVLETLKAFAEGNRVEVIDGYADVFFVAIGALWKTGLTPEQIDQLLDTVGQANSLVPSPQVALMWYEDEATIYVLALLAISALGRLEYLLSDEQLALDVVRAVCISNNTKDAAKTASDVKANVVKGEGYVPPTADLISILERADALVVEASNGSE